MLGFKALRSSLPHPLWDDKERVCKSLHPRRAKLDVHLLFLVRASSAAISLSFLQPFCFCVNYHLEGILLFLFLVVYLCHHFVHPAR